MTNCSTKRWKFPLYFHHYICTYGNENVRDPQQRYFKKMLCSARVVSENTYGMLKGRWPFLYKKTETQPENLR